MQKKFVKALGGVWVEKTGEGGKKKVDKKANAGLPGRLAETLQTVRDTASLQDAAKTRGLAVSTIVKHLEELAEIGKLTRADFAHFLPAAGESEEIHEALAISNDERLSPVFHALGSRYSFETIRLVRLARR